MLVLVGTFSCLEKDARKSPERDVAKKMDEIHEHKKTKKWECWTLCAFKILARIGG